jgi:hypothetical protein
MTPILRRSMKSASLVQDDIPFMDEYVRRGGSETYLQSVTQKRIRLEGEEGVPPQANEDIMTSWKLVKTLYSGRGLVIFLSKQISLPLRIRTDMQGFVALLVETMNTLFSYIKIIAMREIIGTFDHPDEDKSYAYLMCWGLFVGECLDCTYPNEREHNVEIKLFISSTGFSSALAGCRENYLLHNPIRNSLAVLVSPCTTGST